MRGRYQGGSMAGFIIIGAVLALVLVGGLYGLNRYNAEQSKEVATGSDGTTDEQSSDKATSESDSKSDESSGQSNTDSTAKENQDKTTDESKSTGSKTDQSNDELPVTGPADTVAVMVAVAALGFATTHYIQSRSRN